MPSIFLLQSESQLVEMAQQPYDSEKLLQELLARHPSILAGDQFSGPEPRRWLLIGREVGIPAQTDGSDRWSLDHLLIDQHGIPTFVEVKRSTDTRIRREVIGQMFDYVANAVTYWGPGQLRALFDNTCTTDGVDPGERLSDFLRLPTPAETSANERLSVFWTDVDTNLRAGRIRMVFVADAIPPELRRIVEFLNGQMTPAEILAIEIKRFTGSGVTTLVPSVIGQTAQAAAKGNRSLGQSVQWNMPKFLEALRTRKGQQFCRTAERLFQWCDGVLPNVWWGSGMQDGSCFRGIKCQGKNAWLFAVWTYGKIEVQFQWLMRNPPFDSDEARVDLLNRINQIQGVSFDRGAIRRRPSFDLAILDVPGAESAFHSALEFAVEHIKSGK